MRRSWLPIALALAAACGGAQKPESRPGAAESADWPLDLPPPSIAGCEQQQPGNGAIIGSARRPDRDEPLAGIPVIAQSTDGCYWQTGTTDDEGNYAIDGLPPGDYCVLFLYANAEKPISIARGETAMVNVSIAPDDEPSEEQSPCQTKTHGEL